VKEKKTEPILVRTMLVTGMGQGSELPGTKVQRET
jgi:hypothetical protein